METAHSTCEDHLCTPLIRAGPQMPLLHFGPLAKEEPSSALHTEPLSTSLPGQVCGMLLPSHDCLSHRCRFERTCIPGADSLRAKRVTLSNLHLLVPHLSSFSKEAMIYPKALLSKRIASIVTGKLKRCF